MKEMTVSLSFQCNLAAKTKKKIAHSYADLL